MKQVDVYQIVAARVAAGGLGNVELLYCGEGQYRSCKREIKLIDASKTFRWHKGTVVSSNGTAVPALAFWENECAVRIGQSLQRVHILVVQLHMEYRIYGIPADCKVKKLPELCYDESEVSLLIDLANEISWKSKWKERYVKLEHPAADTVEGQRTYWLNAEFKLADFVNGYTATVLNADILAAALDAQFGAIGDVEGIPRGITVFVSNSEADTDYILSTFRSVVFSTEPGLFDLGPIVIANNASKAFPGVVERSTIIQDDQSFITSLVREAEETDRLGRSGGDYSFQPRTSPIVLACQPVKSPYVINITVPAGLEPLEKSTLDIFRVAAARLLADKHLERCKARWYEKMSDPRNYDLNGFVQWRSTIKDYITDRLLICDGIDDDTRSLLHTGTGRLEIANRHSIEKVVAYYRKPEQYIEKLREKSSIKKLSKDTSIGFVHEYRQGKYTGKHVIGFTDKDAIVDTFASAGLTVELVPEFIAYMKEQNFALADKDGRDTLKVYFGNTRLGCYVLLDPRYHSGSKVPER